MFLYCIVLYSSIYIAPLNSHRQTEALRRRGVSQYLTFISSMEVGKVYSQIGWGAMAGFPCGSASSSNQGVLSQLHCSIPPSKTRSLHNLNCLLEEESSPSPSFNFST